MKNDDNHGIQNVFKMSFIGKNSMLPILIFYFHLIVVYFILFWNYCDKFFEFMFFILFVWQM